MFGNCCDKVQGPVEEIQSRPKLVYFNIPAARGDAVRLTLKVLNRPFDDQRVSHAEFLSVEKGKSPTGQLPYMELPNGQILCETIACLMYSAQNSYLYPVELGTSTAENAEMTVSLQQLLRLVESLYAEFGKLYKLKPTEWATESAKTVQEGAKPLLIALDRAIGVTQGGAGFAVNNSLTIADLHIFCFVGYAKTMFSCQAIENQYLNIARVCQSVRRHPAVADYLAAQTVY